jgi:hypothetical protein
MLFKEKLQEISKQVELKHKIDRQFIEIKDKMENAAKNGYHSFTIELISLAPGTHLCLGDLEPDNFVIKTNYLDIYEQKIVDFLCNLGFNKKDIGLKNRAGIYDTIVYITVTW